MAYDVVIGDHVQLMIWPVLLFLQKRVGTVVLRTTTQHLVLEMENFDNDVINQSINIDRFRPVTHINPAKSALNGDTVREKSSEHFLEVVHVLCDVHVVDNLHRLSCLDWSEWNGSTANRERDRERRILTIHHFLGD